VRFTKHACLLAARESGSHQSRPAEQSRNPKLEIRRKFEARKPKLQITPTSVILIFEVRIWRFLRISDFEIRISGRRAAA